MRARDLAAEVAELVRPAPRVLPSEAAAAYLNTERGPWSRDLVPMLVEPLDLLASRDYRGIVFVGPARTGKTLGLVHAGICYAATIANADAMCVQMSQDAARDFSRVEVDRIVRNSPELASRLSARDDNIHEKQWRSGAMLKIAWPTITNLASRTQQFMLLTDYDRPWNRDDVDGEGPLWDLAFKRIETHLSRGKCLAESSPGEEFVADWSPSSPHEAPPCRGIMELYNRGTRARWYWRCLHCGEPFQAAPGLDVFALPKFDELSELVASSDLHELAERYARVACPSCGALHAPADRVALNAGGRWLHEGERFDGERIVGARRRTPIASFWLGGCAAVFAHWDSMLQRYFAAVLAYVRIGDESQLKASATLDFGTPYQPRASLRKHSGAALRKRVESWSRGTLPEGVRFITQAVDAQANRFVVQAHGWGVDLESWVVDRYELGDVDPAAHVEDWLRLFAVARREYALASNPDVRVPVLLTVVDSGGGAGVTVRAYEFWRRARAAGLGRRVRLVKGSGSPNAPRVRRVWPDSSGRSDRPTGGAGDVPVLLVNVNLLKDAVANDLAREQRGPGYVHFPDWLGPEFFDELTAEQRTAKGWRGRSGVRNEALDLFVYAKAAVILLRAERIDWARPPWWARPPEARRPTETPRPASGRTPFPPRSAPAGRPRGGWVRNW